MVVFVRCFDLFLNRAEFVLNFRAALLHHLCQLGNNLLGLATLLSLRIDAFPDVGHVRQWVVPPLARGSGRNVGGPAKRDILPLRHTLHEVGRRLDRLNKLVLLHLLQDLAELRRLFLQFGGGPLDRGNPPDIILEHLIDVDSLVELELFAILDNFLLLLIICHSVQCEEQHVWRILNPELVYALDLFWRADIN